MHQGERHVVRVIREHADRVLAYARVGAALSDPDGGQPAQGGQPAVGQDLLRRFHPRAQDRHHMPVVTDGAVAGGDIDLFRASRPVQHERLVLEQGRLAGHVDLAQARLQAGRGLRPGLGHGPAQRRGMVVGHEADAHVVV